MSLISFVMGAEVHKTSVIELLKERMPEVEMHVYKAAFIEDLFESNRYSDLVVLDLEANISLREVTRFFADSETKIAVICGDLRNENCEYLLDYDIVGFFSVNMQIHEFTDGLQYILDGITYIHPYLAHTMFYDYKNMVHKEVGRPLGLLTRREWEVLEQLVLGGQNDEIAINLKISDKTVKNHITSILTKLDVKDRTNAVLLALREKWFYL